MKASFGIISLGCSKNLVDSEHMIAALEQDGYTRVENMQEAEVAIVNTCGFIESAKQEAIETILETATYKTNGKLRALVVTGCLAERYREEIAQELPEIDAVLGTGSYTDICAAVADALGGQTASFFADANTAVLGGERTILTPHYSAYFKIAEGCSNRCAFCIIPKLRGKYRSREMEELLTEAHALVKAGVQELIVIAQDITKYGMDTEGKRMLPELLRALCKLDFHWIRLHYLYPDQITPELIHVIAQEPKIVKYLDIPLQHASLRILKAMHRPGDGQTFLTLLNDLRNQIPDLVVRSSFIVGLPGETEAEFEELCAFLQKAQIERAGVFTYSAEEGTEAALMPNQIDEETKQQRRLIVEELQSSIIDSYQESRLGTVMEVLCEGQDEQGTYIGRTYADSIEVDGQVRFTANKPVETGAFVPVLMTDYDGVDLIGMVEEGAR